MGLPCVRLCWEGGGSPRQTRAWRPFRAIHRCTADQERHAMIHKGFSHLVSTLDLDRTRAFYEDVLGFKAVVADVLRIKEGGTLRHIFFDVGRDQLIAFMEANDVPGVPPSTMTPASLAGSVCRARSITSPSKPAPRPACWRGATRCGQRGRGHRHRRPRLGQVDLLQGSQWALPGIRLHRPRSYRGRRPPCRSAAPSP